MKMDTAALERFRSATIKTIDMQAIATNQACQLANNLSPQIDDSDGTIARSILRILLIGQQAILLALSVLLHEGDTEIEIPRAFRDAFEDKEE